MKDVISSYLDKFEEPTRQRFSMLYELIHESTTLEIEEKLWAQLPSFYVEKNFVRLIPFKDHINIEAKAVVLHREELPGYKITPKGMLQVYHNQQIPSDLLKVIFKESLEDSTD
ncbi:MAG: hypothetical protein RIN55_07785 [Tissierellaceae bacterium]|nr:hypothetical protein [Tissierellaceae bacterium]